MKNLTKQFIHAVTFDDEEYDAIVEDMRSKHSTSRRNSSHIKHINRKKTLRDNRSGSFDKRMILD